MSTESAEKRSTENRLPDFRARLSHLGLKVRDMPHMQEFYAAVLGLKISDRGVSQRRQQEMVFMSGDPTVHHQLVLVAGHMDAHSIQRLEHVAFTVDTLAALRSVRDCAAATGTPVRATNHGNAWSIYFVDPEGNQLEVFAATPFQVSQPYGRTLDLDLADEEILAATKAAWER